MKFIFDNTLFTKKQDFFTIFISSNEKKSKNVFTLFPVSSKGKKPNLSKEEMLMKLNSTSTKLINVRNSHISLSKKIWLMGKTLNQYLLKTLKLINVKK